MNENDKMQNFSDMVSATEKLTKPWRIALFLTNILWAVVFFAFIAFAYLTPVEVSQDQIIDGQTQNQIYSEGVTNGR